MTEYIENPLYGKLRGVTYEDGKIIDVHIRDTDDVVKVFVPARHGRWVKRGRRWQCTNCKVLMSIDGTPKENLLNYCPNCGAKMDEGAD